ncbi:putative family 31 glucosidase ORF2 [Dirofilaria immitis]
MADDLHDVARYLNDMRICFIAMTVIGYIVLILYGIIFCVRRNQRQRGTNNINSRTRGRWDFQVKVENRDQQQHNQNDDLVSVRSDGLQGITPNFSLGRNYHRNPPSFMRHGIGMNHAQQTTRLMADQDSGIVKHQVPHIITDPPSSEEHTPPAKVPELLKGAIEM